MLKSVSIYIYTIIYLYMYTHMHLERVNLQAKIMDKKDPRLHSPQGFVQNSINRGHKASHSVVELGTLKKGRNEKKLVTIVMICQAMRKVRTVYR